MGISTALNIAASGLRAMQTQSDITARNIANSMTEGYTRKSTTLQTTMGQVYVATVDRQVDQLLDRLDRTNISTVTRAQTIADGVSTYTSLLGQPEDGTSPVAGLTSLYNSLQAMAGSPLATTSQLGVLDAAKSLAKTLNSLSTAAGALNDEVDLNIRYDVSDVNDSLRQLAQYNQRLGQTGGQGVEAAELKDEMGRLLDTLAGYMEIQTTFNADGAVNVYTSGGTELVNGKKAATLTYDFGTKSLIAGDIDITPGKTGVRGFEGGSLGGLFELANTTIPTINDQLDNMAQLLIDRFSAADSTLAAGESGLFVDSNTGIGAGTLSGLAGRISVNAAVDPDQGGDSKLLVTGMGSTGSLEEGDTSIVNAMIKAIDLKDNAATPLGQGTSLSDYAANMVSRQQQMRVQAEKEAAQAQTAGATISASRQNLQGVNIDDEMQQLLVIEASFAANAKVLTSLQTMLDTLLEAV